MSRETKTYAVGEKGIRCQPVSYLHVARQSVQEDDQVMLASFTLESQTTCFVPSCSTVDSVLTIPTEYGHLCA